MMNASCVAGCLDAEIPARLTFLSLYQWPDSEAEFVRVLSMREGHPRKPRGYESYACRQMYLRSYTFSKKETLPEKTKKCLRKIKATMVLNMKNMTAKKMLSLLGKYRENLLSASCAVMAAVFRHLLACTTSVDVRDQHA